MQTVVETQPVPVPAMPESVAAAITAPSSQLMAMLQFMAARQRPRDEEGFRRKLREEAAALEAVLSPAAPVLTEKRFLMSAATIATLTNLLVVVHFNQLHLRVHNITQSILP